MSSKEYTKLKAQQAAQIDFHKGLTCDSARHQAVKDSAWDEWYKYEYVMLLLNKHYPTTG